MAQAHDTHTEGEAASDQTAACGLKPDQRVQAKKNGELEAQTTLSVLYSDVLHSRS